jgi:hypothetical protein
MHGSRPIDERRHVASLDEHPYEGGRRQRASGGLGLDGLQQSWLKEEASLEGRLGTQQNFSELQRYKERNGNKRERKKGSGNFWERFRNNFQTIF